MTDNEMEILEIGYPRGSSGTASRQIIKWRVWQEAERGTQQGYWVYYDIS